MLARTHPTLAAYIDIGGFDAAFLLYLLVIGVVIAISMNALVALLRERFAKPG